MANEPLDQTDGTAENKGSISGHRALMDASLNSIHYAANADYAVQSDAPSTTESSRGSGSILSGPDTVELFRTAVDKARLSMQESLAGEEKISSNTVPLSLTVDLNRRGLESLPEEIVQILKQDVERIVLSHNQIGSLPYSFSECTNITYLNLRANQFKEFPKALFTLQKLQVLDLSRNKITQLPEEMQNMKSLRFLSVMHNNIEDLPLSLGFLESLRLLKLTGNPLKESLKHIADGNDSTPSPLVSSIGENERDTVSTIRIKQYLKAEVVALESSGESSGSPLETPRPLKRNTSLRFPVVPASSSSESAGDQKSPAFSKPPVPARSHYRPGSAQGAALPTATFRRPGIAPLLIGNERNRSNSESILQAIQNTRNKRVAIMTKRTPELAVLSEANSSRNSFHLRGISHGSALKPKHGRATRSAGGNGPSNPVSPIDQLVQGTFIRRLSSVPEYRVDHPLADSFVEGARGFVFCLHLANARITGLLSMISDDASPRPTLERVYYNASTHYERLDQEITAYNKIQLQDSKRRKRVAGNVRNACRACIVAYRQVGQLLAKCSRQLIKKGDRRHIRTLLYLTYGSIIESLNAFVNIKSGSISSKSSRAGKLPVPKLQEELPRFTVRPGTPSRERLLPNKRNRSDTLNSLRNQVPAKTPANPQSAVPLYVNGRSRSNSRTNTFAGSTMSSVANTPRSGESFQITSTSLIPPLSIGMPGYTDQSQDVMFEKIYLELKKAVSLGTSSLPTLCSQFSQCLKESSMFRYEGKSLHEFWMHLLERSRQCLDKCDALRLRLSTVKLKDPEVRYSMDFWGHVTKYMTSFLTLCSEIKKAKDTNRAVLAPLDPLRLLKSVHTCVKAVTQHLRESPWAFVLSGGPRPPNILTTPQWHTHNHLTGFLHGRLNGQRHTRDNSGSSSSPYQPTTPLSAALGPAIQATIPSTSSSSTTLFDRSFQGDVFQRADSLLSMQQSMLHRR